MLVTHKRTIAGVFGGAIHSLGDTVSIPARIGVAVFILTSFTSAIVAISATFGRTTGVAEVATFCNVSTINILHQLTESVLDIECATLTSQ